MNARILHAKLGHIFASYLLYDFFKMSLGRQKVYNSKLPRRHLTVSIGRQVFKDQRKEASYPTTQKY